MAVANCHGSSSGQPPQYKTSPVEGSIITSTPPFLMAQIPSQVRRVMATMGDALKRAVWP